MIQKDVKSALIQYGVALVVFSIVMYYMMTSVFKSVTVASEEKIKTRIDELQSTVVTLQTKHDALMTSIDNLEANNAYIADMLIGYSNQIDQYNRELSELKKQYREKIRNVDNYTASELDSIFANKYGWKLKE
jgi:predicted nuclease with TOPRIM domain